MCVCVRIALQFKLMYRWLHSTHIDFFLQINGTICLIYIYKTFNPIGLPKKPKTDWTKAESHVIILSARLPESFLSLQFWQCFIRNGNFWGNSICFPGIAVITLHWIFSMNTDFKFSK